MSLDLVPDPVLSTFPSVLSQYDLMDALKVAKLLYNINLKK